MASGARKYRLAPDEYSDCAASRWAGLEPSSATLCREVSAGAADPELDAPALSLSLGLLRSHTWTLSDAVSSSNFATLRLYKCACFTYAIRSCASPPATAGLLLPPFLPLRAATAASSFATDGAAYEMCNACCFHDVRRKSSIVSGYKNEASSVEPYSVVHIPAQQRSECELLTQWHTHALYSRHPQLRTATAHAPWPSSSSASRT